MSGTLNKYKYPGAKRLMLEAQELKDKTEDYCAQPIDDNLFEWHFTVRGPPETAFEGGFYHGRLSFPTEYPMKPPSIILFTPNGRFETNKKICLSISGYHPETWQPSWSVRTALLALIAFMPTKANRAIGSLDYSDAERRKLARNSRTWRCEICGPIRELLKHPEQTTGINNTNGIQLCEASTSGRGSSNASHGEELQDGKSGASDRSDSDGETRDSSTDSQSSTSISNFDLEGSPITTKTQQKEQDQKNSARLSEANSSGQRDGCNTQPATTSFDEDETHPGPVLQEGTSSISTEGRKSYPPLVFVSIFILLFLLILRRIVMIIQS